MTMREKLYQMVEAELNLPQGWDTTKNFIELGGQSIQMMKLQMNILKTFGITLTFQELFENNTINRLLHCLEQKQA